MGFAGMYDSGGTIPRGQFGIVGENGPEIVNGPANVTGRKRTADLARVAATLNPSRTEPASAKQRPERGIVLPPDSVNGPANIPVINRTTELVKLAATVSPVRDVTASPDQRPESRLILPPEIVNAPVKLLVGIVLRSWLISLLPSCQHRPLRKSRITGLTRWLCARRCSLPWSLA